MKVRELMRSDVVTAAPADDFKELVERMLARDVSCLPVVDPEGHVLGIVSETDLLAAEAFDGKKRGALALVGAALRGHDAWLVSKSGSTRARDLMTREVVCTEPDEDSRLAALRMLDWAVNHLPVLADGRLVGIVSRQDLLRTFRRTDHGIHAEISAILRDETRIPPGVHASVDVWHGTVSLVGTVAHPEDIVALESMARSIDGVVAVECDLAVRQDHVRRPARAKNS
jgi:CBS domain-containing protein